MNTGQFIDFSYADPKMPTRWEHGDGEGALRALDAALERVGLVDALRPAFKLLDRAEELVAASRVERRAAEARLEEANRRLLASDGVIDVAGYGRVLAECAPWISDDSAAAVGVGDAARSVRSRATATVFAMSPGVYQQLQVRCREVVDECAAIPALPREVWSATSSGQAQLLAVRAGQEVAWSQLVRTGDMWDQIHSAGQLLRETGVFAGELMFTFPTSIAVALLNPAPAMEGGLEEVRRLPAPLRLRAAIDRGWQPGLYLKSDHDAAAAVEPKPKRRLLAGLRPRGVPDPAAEAEFV